MIATVWRKCRFVRLSETGSRIVSRVLLVRSADTQQSGALIDWFPDALQVAASIRGVLTLRPAQAGARADPQSREVESLALGKSSP